MTAERLISRGYTNAEKALNANYARGDVVAFHRPYKRLGVAKGDELRVAGVDRKAHTVMLEGKDGQSVAWGAQPARRALGRGRGVSGPKRWSFAPATASAGPATTPASGSSTAQTAEVAGVSGGKVAFRLGDGRTLDLAPGDPQLRHIDRAWASTVHAFPGQDGGYRDRRDGSQPSEPHHAEDPLCGDQPGTRPRRAGDRRQGGAARDARSGDRGAHRGARSGRAGEARRAAPPGWTWTGARDATAARPNRGSRNGVPGRTWRTRGRRRASIATSVCKVPGPATVTLAQKPQVESDAVIDQQEVAEMT